MNGDSLVSVTDSAGVSDASMRTFCELADSDVVGGRYLLPVAVDAAVHADRALVFAVRKARAEGVTWQAIGDLLGVTRSAAHQRFSKLV